jgi:hypothetical protein
LFGDFKILTVTSLYIFEILCFIKRIRSIRPNILIFVITTQKENRICMSNYATMLTVKKGVINMGIQIHNNLPSELKRIESVKFFKNKLKSYLL